MNVAVDGDPLGVSSFLSPSLGPLTHEQKIQLLALIQQATLQGPCRFQHLLNGVPHTLG